MTHKPDIATFNPLPEGTYLCVISDWSMVDKREDFLNKEKEEWKEKHPTMDFPWWKEKQYCFELKVIDGEYAGETLPRRYTTLRLSTDERNGLYKLLKAIDGISGDYGSLKERVEAGDAPDFDTEVKGKAVSVVLGVRDDGKNKIEAVTRTENNDSVAAKMAALGFEVVVEKDSDMKVAKVDEGEEIPF